MAAGVPVLVSRACGAAELVVEGISGFTFDPRDPAALAQAIGRAVGDAGRLGEAGRASISCASAHAFGEGLLAAIRLGSARRARGLGVAGHLLRL